MENSKSFRDIPEGKRTRKDLLQEALRRIELRVNELTSEGSKRNLTATENNELVALKSERMQFQMELQTLERKQ